MITINVININTPMKLKSKKFQYDHELTDWVNSQLEEIVIVSITSKGQFEGEGYTLFYKQ